MNQNLKFTLFGIVIVIVTVFITLQASKIEMRNDETLSKVMTQDPYLSKEQTDTGRTLNQDISTNNTNVTIKKMNKTAQAGDQVVVLYTGKLADGTVFDASSKHGNEPFAFIVGAGQVIRGWDEGLVGVKIGEKKTLVIPPEKGYGAKGQGPIPANATLTFDIEVVDIVRAISLKDL